MVGRGWARLGRPTILGLLVGMLIVGAAATPDASALVSGRPYVSVTPAAGPAPAPFTVRGKYVWPAPCAAPVPLTFKFYWYKVITYKVLLWTATASSCTAGEADTGSSPPLYPPPPLDYAGTFVIQVAVYFITGAPAGPTYTNTAIYSVIATKPGPPTRSSPSPQCGLPGQAACPSAGPRPCNQPSAALPPSAPGSREAAAMLALALLGMIPIGGMAMVFSPGLSSRRERLRRLAALVGLSLMLVAAAGCAATNSPTAQGTPTQAQAQPSASPTPSC